MVGMFISASAETIGSAEISRIRCRALADAGARGRRPATGPLEETARLRERIRTVTADVRREADARTIVADAVDAAGRLDVLVNSAGIVVRTPLRRTDLEVARAIWNTNILTRSWALELAARGIRVSAVARCPTESEALERERARIPFGRRGEPEEIASIVVALASPAARWVTGQVIGIDGVFSLV
jgi:NAD(P)-dependent dehydrogenase (short-subunit alcohol dehydrogenase family)